MSGDDKDKTAQPGMDDDKAHQKLDAKLMLRLWSWILPYRKLALVCLLLSLGLTALRLMQPVIVHSIIDTAVAHIEPAAAGEAAREALVAGEGARAVTTRALGFLLLVLSVFGMEAAFNYLTENLGQRSMHDLRMAVYRHVTRLDVSFFDRNPVGRLVTRMTSDISTLNDLFASGVVAMLAEFLMILGLIGVMFAYSWRMTLVVLCAIPCILLVIHLFREHARRWYLEARTRLAMLNTFLQENVAGMATVQSFNREARNFDRFSDLNDDYRKAQVQTIWGFALFYPALTVISNLTLAAVIWVGGRRLIEATVTGGEPLTYATLFLFVQCVNMLFTPLRQLSEKYNLLQSAMASSSRIFRLLDTKAQIVPPEEMIRPGPLSDRIEFRDVSFEYRKGEPILKEVSFTIGKGQTVAVVGATGAGKSTLINLLTRFYDVTGGAILLDGNDIRKMDPHDLRRRFAVVLQEVFLFSGTVAGNVRLARPDLTDDQLWDLLGQVRADDFVRELEGGINARVSERGGTFSTGQKQLLAFARALAADPEILVLDEATANVDTGTEQRIQQAIATLLEGRTALVIAHRISTIQKADLILVMHHGRVHESGTHDQLLALDGLYRRLYELQYRSEAVTEGAAEATA